MLVFFFYNPKTAYEMRISDWSSDVCSSDLRGSCRGSRDRSGCRHRSAAASGSGLESRGCKRKERAHRSEASAARAGWAAGAAFGRTVSACRTEERRVGDGCVSTCRYGWSANHKKTNTTMKQVTIKRV